MRERLYRLAINFVVGLLIAAVIFALLMGGGFVNYFFFAGRLP